MAERHDFDRVRQGNLYQPRTHYQPPERDEATMRRSIANAAPGNVGFAYSAPEGGAGPEAPVTRLGLAWRIAASIVLAAIGINALVQIVRMMTQTEPAWVAALGMAIVAMLALAYPVVNVVRVVRAVRRRRQRPAA